MNRPNDQPPPPTSGVVIVGALVAFGAFGTAAVLFVAGESAYERLGLLFAMFGAIVAALIAALRSDHAAGMLNGGFNERIRRQVDVAMRIRAAGDPHDRWTDPPADPPAAPGGPHDPAGQA